jgi:hypothetical protein
LSFGRQRDGAVLPTRTARSATIQSVMNGCIFGFDAGSILGKV